MLALVGLVTPLRPHGIGTRSTSNSEQQVTTADRQCVRGSAEGGRSKARHAQDSRGNADVTTMNREQAGTAGEDRTGGSRRSEMPWEDSGLTRVLRGAPLLVLLDKLPDKDKASLTATCWGALETMLRDTRAVLKVHPDDPVLAGLARRVRDGPCCGSVTLCGIQMPATDAGALLGATQRLGIELPPSVAEPFPETEGTFDVHDYAPNREKKRACIDLMRALSREPIGVHVTGLTVPTLWNGPTVAADATAVAEILQTRTIKDNLRSLKLAVGKKDSFGRNSALPDVVVGMLHGALRGLSALQHLELFNTPPAWACSIGQYSDLTTLALREPLQALVFDPAECEAFLDDLERAKNLRTLDLALRLPDGAEMRPRAVPRGLEVLRMTYEHPLRWWEATGLRSVELTLSQMRTTPQDDAANWLLLAELIDRSKGLRRLAIEFATIPGVQPVLAVMSALERSAVEDLVYACARYTVGGVSEDLTAGFVSLVHNAAALRALELVGAPSNELFGFDLAVVVTALQGSKTLRKLRLDWDHGPNDADQGTEEIGAALRGLLGRNTSLVELHLSSLAWTPEGFRELLGGLGANRTLQVLRICCEYLSSLEDGDVCELVDALYGEGRHEGRQLHTLEVSTPCATDYSVRACIAPVLADERSCKLRRLGLDLIKAKDDGMEAIARALRHNRWLESLTLCVDSDYVTPGGPGWLSLTGSLADNTTLRHLEIKTSNLDACRIRLVGKVLHAQQFALAQR
ncbi:unnamed protein product [Pedinophyceae sp. YPF-701]|nr:unnamed protein product [Pedinophyceae sp. YPF-701]